MKKTSILGLILMIAIGFAANAAGQSAGRPAAENEFESFKLGKRGSFRISLPAKPASDSMSVKSGRETFTATMYTSTSDDLVTVVGDIADLPLSDAQITTAMKNEFFKSVRDGIISGIREEMEKSDLKIKLTLGDQTQVSASGFGGFEQEMAIGPLRGRARLLTGRGHAFIFLVIALSENGDSQMDTVLDSFEFIGNTK